MRPANRYQTVIEILDDFFEKDFAPLDRMLHFYFKSNRFVGSKDRQIISAIIYAVVRNYFKLKWMLTKAGCDCLNARAFVIALVLKVKSDMKLDEIFVGEKYSPYIFTKAEKAFIEKLETIQRKSIPEPYSLECSDDAFEYLKPLKDYQSLLKSLETEACFDIRVNPFLIDREEASQILKKSGYEVIKTKFSPYGLRFEKRVPIDQHELFKDGKIEVQDEAAQLASLLVGAKPGDRVMDLCAGAGGKALLIAGMMQNKGELILSDISKNRLERSKVRFRRAKFSNFQIKSADEKKWFKRNHHKFDKVLVDSPCTGVGTWRRNPESKLRPLGNFLTELLPVQQGLLEKAAKLVKPGGHIIYVTCSLLREENESQVEMFLATHDQFDIKLIDSLNFSEDNSIVEDKKFFKTSPDKHGMDGFFGVVLERKI